MEKAAIAVPTGDDYPGIQHCTHCAQPAHDSRASVAAPTVYATLLTCACRRGRCPCRWGGGDGRLALRRGLTGGGRVRIARCLTFARNTVRSRGAAHHPAAPGVCGDTVLFGFLAAICGCSKRANRQEQQYISRPHFHKCSSRAFPVGAATGHRFERVICSAEVPRAQDLPRLSKHVGCHSFGGGKERCLRTFDATPQALAYAHSPGGEYRRTVPGQVATGSAGRRRYTSLFRNAASPASDTSTHFLSGAASAT
jgi:hypothetical protein